jgi:hypothetical protein
MTYTIYVGVVGNIYKFKTEAISNAGYSSNALSVALVSLTRKPWTHLIQMKMALININ